MGVLEHVEPYEVFHYFEEICKIPHGSYDTKRISDYCVDFARERNLVVYQDDLNNVIIKKPGTAGYENSEPVILQGHLDMVCAKVPESNHDFRNDPLNLEVEDGFVSAKGTSLGGDDGIAIAMILAVLDSDGIVHPPIEAVFTTDEEVSMSGAKGLDLSVLEGRKLINIDSEAEGVLTIGCAGALQGEVHIPITRIKKEGTLIRVRLHGLLGGHSGAEIHKQRGNAHKMLGRLLTRMEKDMPVYLIEVNGGQQNNVISLDSKAEIMIDIKNTEKALSAISEMEHIWKDEFMGEEPGLKVSTRVFHDSTIDVCDEKSTKRVTAYLNICPNGAIEYNRKLPGMVETSVNLGIVETTSEYVRIAHMVRSSVDSRTTQIWEQIEQCAQLCGAESICFGSYPAWPVKVDSELQNIMKTSFIEIYGYEPEISTVHAGLECALFFVMKPELDCVSIGPDILDIHSVNERLDLASTKRTWKYLKDILKRCK